MNREQDLMSQEFKDYVSYLVRKFQDVVFAGEYSIDTIFKDENNGDDKVDILATINVDPVYLDATITVYNKMWEHWQEKNYRRLAHAVLHELCHILTQPLYDLAYETANQHTQQFVKEIWERQTSRIANSLFDLVPSEVWKPQNV